MNAIRVENHSLSLYLLGERGRVSVLMRQKPPLSLTPSPSAGPGDSKNDRNFNVDRKDFIQ